MKVAVSSAMSGCYFWLPFEEIAVNEPPTITDGYPAIGSTIVLDSSMYSVVAIVRDPDDEPEDLYFRWTITSQGTQEGWFLTDGVGADSVGNTLPVYFNEAYDQKTLTFVVEDASGSSARAEWTLSTGGDNQ